eukprot:TRINITY_DN21027_c0_g2_i1.p1 TRINITY_DN21027_c0_g2~~TRINITY_DN21027_c0_g2_i1.p1  ORF type:complete len:1287 (-),score=433.16 TRINITY_DN21027_c0_g2_i1:53-3886(-)
MAPPYTMPPSPSSDSTLGPSLSARLGGCSTPPQPQRRLPAPHSVPVEAPGNAAAMPLLAVPAVQLVPAVPVLAPAWPYEEEAPSESGDDTGWLLESAKAQADSLCTEIRKLGLASLEGCKSAQVRIAAADAVAGKRPHRSICRGHSQSQRHAEVMLKEEAEQIYRAVEAEFARLHLQQQDLMDAGAAERFDREEDVLHYEAALTEVQRELREESLRLMAAQSALDTEQKVREEAESSRQAAEDSLGRLGLELSRARSREAASAAREQRLIAESAEERAMMHQEEAQCQMLREELSNLRSAMRNERHGREEAEARRRENFEEAVQLEGEKRQLEAAAEEQRQSSVERQRRQVALERDNQQLRERLQALRAASDSTEGEVQRLQHVLAEARREGEDLASQRDAEREMAVQCQQKVQRSTELLSEAMASKAEACAALEDREALQVMTASSRYASEVETCASLQNQLASEEGEVEELRHLLAQQRAAFTELSASAVELRRSEVDVHAEAVQHFAELGESREALRSLQSVHSERGKAHELATTQLKEAKESAEQQHTATLRQHRAELERVEAAAADRSAVLKEELGRERSRMEKLRRQLKSAADERDEALARDWQYEEQGRKHSELQRRHSALETERLELQQALESERSGRASRERLAAELAAERESLQAELEQERRKVRQMQDLQRRAELAEDEQSDLRKELEGERTAVRDLRRTVERLTAQLQRAEDEAKDLHAQQEQLRQDKVVPAPVPASRESELEEELQKLKEEHEMQQAAVQVATAKEQQEREQHHRQLQEVQASHVHELVQRQELLDMLQEEQRVMQESHRQQELQLQQLQQQCSRLTVARDEAIRGREAEKTQRQQLQQQCARLQSARDEALQSLEEAQESSRQLERGLEAATAERDELASEDARWSAAAERQRQEVEAIERRLADAEAAYEDVQQELQELRESSAAERQMLADEVSRHSALARELREENCSLERRASDAEAVVTAAEEEQQQQLAAIITERDGLAQSLRRQEKRLHHLEEQLSSGGITAQARLDEVSRDLEEERLSRQQLQQQLSTAHAAHEDLEAALEEERQSAERLRLRLELPSAKAEAEAKLWSMRRRLAAARGEDFDDERAVEASCGGKDAEDAEELLCRVSCLEGVRDELARSLDKERQEAEVLRARLHVAQTSRLESVPREPTSLSPLQEGESLEEEEVTLLLDEDSVAGEVEREVNSRTPTPPELPPSAGLLRRRTSDTFRDDQLLSTSTHCSRCGNMFMPDAIFCRKCGRKRGSS